MDTNRRTTAAAAATVDRSAPPQTGPRTYVAGSGAVTRSEREALRDGIRAGAKMRLRLAAQSIVDVANVTGGPTTMLEVDPITGEHLDAREVLAEAAALARPGRGTGHGATDPQRMAPRHATALARYAAGCAARMARPALTDSERWEAESEALARVLALTDLPGHMPRWDAIGEADSTGDQPATREVGTRGNVRAVTAYSAAYHRWRGWAFLQARKLNAERAERVAAETPADWTEADGEAPTPEQAAAAASEAATARLTDALSDVAPSAYFLAAAAPGGALSGAERDALAIKLTGCTCPGRHREGCTGITRADLAAARGKSVETVKSNVKRGAAALARRVPDEHTGRRWAREASRRMARTLHQPTEADALAALAAAGPLHSGARKPLAWPDRIGRVADGEFLLPPAPSGAGLSARRVLAAHWTPSPWKPLPRATLSGAPALPAHRFLARPARALRTLAAIAPRPVAEAPTGATLARHACHPLSRSARPVLHPSMSAITDRERASAARDRAAAMRWIAPGYGA